MPDFANASVMLDSKSRTRAVRRPSTDAWHTRHVCATLPIVIVETLDVIARDTGRSRSLVMTDALLAHPDIAAALTSRGGR
jgi:hypothetical protein